MKISEIERKELLRYIEHFSFHEYIKNKTIMITGSNGMTAQAIIKWLLLENETFNANCRIIASTRKPQQIPEYIDETDNIVLCKYGEEDSIEERIDYIIHAAAPTGRDFFMTKPVETFRIIVDQTEKMLEIAKKHHATMAYLSSVEAYGTPHIDGKLGESYIGSIDSLDIRSGYPLGKKAAEFLCHSSSVEYKTDVKIVRPSSIHGLFQPYSEERIFNQITKCILNHNNLIMKSNGLTKKPVVYTLDAVSAVLMCLFKGESGATYNITNASTYMTMKDLCNCVFQEFAPELRVEFDVQDRSKTGYLPEIQYNLDTSKLEALGWYPITDLKTMYQIDLERFGV